MSSPTACPMESVFAELAAGTLEVDARRSLEEHIDQCDACTELVGMLGVFPSTLDRQRRVQSPAGDSPDPRQVPWWLTDRAAIASTLLATQLFWSLMLWFPATKWLTGVDHRGTHRLLWAFAAYASVFGIVGPMVAVAALLAVWRRRRWAEYLIAVQAAVAIPSLAMTPLAIVTLLYLRRQMRPRVRLA